jgi:signal transduction histidine kinase
VQEHKGSIEIESTMGEGTTFVIRLPAAARASSPVGPPAADEPLAKAA